MKNDMKLIMESWRKQSLLLENLSQLIKNKALDDKDIEEIGQKLSNNEGFELAVQMFSALSEVDPEEMDELGEGPMDWMNLTIIKGMMAKDDLINTLESDPRFAPILKLSGPALAAAFLLYKQKSGGVNPDDFATATEMIAKKGKIGLEGLASATLLEVAPQSGVYSVTKQNIAMAKRVEKMYRRAGLTKKADIFARAIELGESGEIDYEQFSRMLDSASEV